MGNTSSKSSIKWSELRIGLKPESSIGIELKRNGVKTINKFLSKTLYRNELQFRRSSEEVECITSAVQTVVKQLMALTGKEDQLCEISHTYMVGSMAEGTRLVEPDEFDFLVVIKYFSETEVIRLSSQYQVYVNQNKISPIILGSSHYININENGKLTFKPHFLTTILSHVISKTETVTKSHGALFVQSPTVCHHGPASAIKLKWKPTSQLSTPLDIFVDITPCIEQHGIDTVIKAKDVAIPAHYEALVRDDTYMLIPLHNKTGSFIPTFTTTEVTIVNTLSPHHKTCYMILKYCLGNILASSATSNDTLTSPYPSYCIKTFVIRHVDRCKAWKCLTTCVLDILEELDLELWRTLNSIDGIFGKYIHSNSYSIMYSQFISEIKDKLLQIGKNGYSEERHDEFRKACHRESQHPIIKERAETLARNHAECHLPENCKIHN